MLQVRKDLRLFLFDELAAICQHNRVSLSLRRRGVPRTNKQRTKQPRQDKKGTQLNVATAGRQPNQWRHAAGQTPEPGRGGYRPGAATKWPGTPAGPRARGGATRRQRPNRTGAGPPKAGHPTHGAAGRGREKSGQRPGMRGRMPQRGRQARTKGIGSRPPGPGRSPGCPAMAGGSKRPRASSR